MPAIDQLKLKNSFLNELPADSNKANRPRQVLNACYSFVNPQVPTNPALIHIGDEMSEMLELDKEDDDKCLAILSGAENFPGMKPYAMCYGGHQFGHWAGQLGDGRAINIAEIWNKNGKWVLQLKGAGQTPYSRTADGLAVLRSSIREYLMSEAMFHLGIETTRALSLALTGDEVLRDILYNGNPAYEKGAVVCRVAPSFIRFGSFEIFTARKDIETLRTLVDYTIRNFYADLGEPGKETYLRFFEEVASRSLTMVLNWQRVGFVHGVMNTDNMSILGLTIDYGPYGWLEPYDPAWTPNTTDAQQKRYRFGNQPSVVLWNLMQLANALYPLIEDVPALEKVLDNFRDEYQLKYLEMMKAKLGLFQTVADDAWLIEQLTDNLYKSEVDMTLFFRNLKNINPDKPVEHLKQIKEDSYLAAEVFDQRSFEWGNWLKVYTARIKEEGLDIIDRIKRMDAVNPKYVLRNYMAQLAIDEVEKDSYNILSELHELLKRPYEEQPEYEKWFAKRPDWAKEKVGCSMLSCSS